MKAGYVQAGDTQIGLRYLRIPRKEMVGFNLDVLAYCRMIYFVPDGSMMKAVDLIDILE